MSESHGLAQILLSHFHFMFGGPLAVALILRPPNFLSGRLNYGLTPKPMNILTYMAKGALQM